LHRQQNSSHPAWIHDHRQYDVSKPWLVDYSKHSRAHPVAHVLASNRR
jgi:hypothetical protein